MSARLSTPTRAFGSLIAVTLSAALVAAATPGLATALRRWFAFEPEPVAAIAAAFTVWLANMRVLGLVLLAALAARERRLVPALDLAVAVVLGDNVAVVGLALGAYGLALLPWLAHVPLEWAGLAVGLAAYARARDHTPCLPAVAKAGAAGAGVLALAAVVETWATPLALP
jgi:hypothetical protein